MIAGLELGGTKCFATLASEVDSVVAQTSIPTTDPKQTLAALEAVLDGWSFDAIGIATFGPVDLDPTSSAFGMIGRTPKPGWTGVSLFERFKRRYECPIAIHTDVMGAALAEGLWGTAVGVADHAYVTIGTGVGIGIVVGGAPMNTVLHGEGGHIRIVRTIGDDFPGACTFHGDCIDGLISGPALARRVGLPAMAIPSDHAVWSRFVEEIAVLLHNLLMICPVQRVAIGGGVMMARSELFPQIRTRLVQSLAGYGFYDTWVHTINDRIGPPGLGVMAGPLGAIAIGQGISTSHNARRRV